MVLLIVILLIVHYLTHLYSVCNKQVNYIPEFYQLSVISRHYGLQSSSVQQDSVTSYPDYSNTYLFYPLFKSPIPLPFSIPLALPLGVPKSSFPPPRKPIANSGVVFYVYSFNQCKGKDVYMNQVGYNSKIIKNLDPTISTTLVTNCNIPVAVSQYLNIIVPIHMKDVVNTTQKQWRTRMLYNAYLPYNYSFIIDSHVFPCDAKAPREILDLFESSQVDISFSNRENTPNRVSGGAVLSHWSEGSFKFWQKVYNIMQNRKSFDDQGPMKAVIESEWRKNYSFKWLSSNWFFASHGITENGKFVGSARCYRSSVVVTGPLRWIHGSLDQCKIMNGPNNEYIYKPRCFFHRGNCSTTGGSSHPVFSESQLKRDAFPYSSPELYWSTSSGKNSTSLFW